VDKIIYSIAIALITLSFFTACAKTRPGNEPWSYGRFCGPGEPNVENLSKKEAIAKLESTEPDDDIDAACKAHDMCYANHGYFNYECDKKLLKTLSDMHFRGKYSGECLNVKFQVMAPFTAVTPALGSSDGHLLGSIVSLPVRVLFSAMPIGLGILSGAATPACSGKCKSAPLHY